MKYIEYKGVIITCEVIIKVNNLPDNTDIKNLYFRREYDDYNYMFSMDFMTKSGNFTTYDFFKDKDKYFYDMITKESRNIYLKKILE